MLFRSLLLGVLILGASFKVFSDEGFPEKEIRESGGEILQFQLTGSALREFLFFDIYEIASYLSAESSPEQDDLSNEALSAALLTSPAPKMLRMNYLRDLSVDRIKQVLLDGFKNNCSQEEWRKIEPEIERFMFNIKDDINLGDQLELLWLPENKLRVTYRAQAETQQHSHLFLKTLWSIWFGPDSVVDRRALLKAFLR